MVPCCSGSGSRIGSGSSTGSDSRRGSWSCQFLEAELAEVEVVSLLRPSTQTDSGSCLFAMKKAPDIGTYRERWNKNCQILQSCNAA